MCSPKLFELYAVFFSVSLCFAYNVAGEKQVSHINNIHKSSEFLHAAFVSANSEQMKFFKSKDGECLD